VKRLLFFGYETKRLQRDLNPLEPSYGHLLETLPHGSLQKVKGYVVRLIDPEMGYFS